MSDPLEYVAPPEEQSTLPPESAPLPEEYPPPESSGGPTGGRKKFDCRAALLLVTALGALTVTTGLGAKRAETRPDPSPAPTQQTAALPEQTHSPEPAQKTVALPEQTPTPAAPPRTLSDAEILLRFGPWQNDAGVVADFLENGSGWWWDGEYLGRMIWMEEADGSVSYVDSAAYLGYLDQAQGSSGLSYIAADAVGTVSLTPDGDGWDLLLRDPFASGECLWDSGAQGAPDVSAVADVLTTPTAEILCGTVWQAVWPQEDNCMSYLTAAFSPEGLCTVTLVPYNYPDAEPQAYTFSWVPPEGLELQSAVTVESFSVDIDNSTITTSGFVMPVTLVFAPEGVRLTLMNIFSWGYTDFMPAPAD